MPARQRKKLQRDRGQIEKMRLQIEKGVEMVPVQVWQRPDGKYSLLDGRHRYLACCLADEEYIEAEILG